MVGCSVFAVAASIDANEIVKPKIAYDPSNASPGSGSLESRAPTSLPMEPPPRPPTRVSLLAGRTPLRSCASVYVPAASAAAMGRKQSVDDSPSTGGDTQQSKVRARRTKGTKQLQQSREQERCDEQDRTTVMMCHLPLSYTSDLLIDLLKSHGFSKKFDFVHVPINFTVMLGVGYAFVNLTTHEHAEQFMKEFNGFDGWASSFSKEACEVCWSHCQGLAENVARYQNSPMMGPEVPTFYKPVLLKDGERAPFPEPVNKLGKFKTRRRLVLYKCEEDGVEMVKVAE